jgi:hypothetical protein
MARAVGGAVQEIISSTFQQAWITMMHAPPMAVMLIDIAAISILLLVVARMYSPAEIVAKAWNAIKSAISAPLMLLRAAVFIQILLGVPNQLSFGEQVDLKSTVAVEQATPAVSNDMEQQVNEDKNATYAMRPLSLEHRVLVDKAYDLLVRLGLYGSSDARYPVFETNDNGDGFALVGEGAIDINFERMENQSGNDERKQVEWLAARIIHELLHLMNQQMSQIEQESIAYGKGSAEFYKRIGNQKQY